MDHSAIINYLSQKGKSREESWEDISKRFGYINGEAARYIWKSYRMTKKIEKIDNKVIKELYIKELEDKVVKFEEDFKNGKASVDYKGPVEIKTKEQLFKECNVDESKWVLDKMVVNAWGKEGNQSWQVKAWLSSIKVEQLFQDKFVEFLSKRIPTGNIYLPPKRPILLPNANLVINKQDEHLNKYDVGGWNIIEDRFSTVYNQVDIVLKQSHLSNNLDRITYIVGSDEFNSEWTSLTTKGTPQTNILEYEESFKRICDYEISMINNLRKHCTILDVIYIQGNHDQYVGWHLAHFLENEFKLCEDVVFDISNTPTKYRRYSNTAMMFNHSDAIKPDKLAGMFAIEFRKEWSLCENFYIFSGDKHHLLAKDYNGITFFQVPALSTAKSKWDEKNGYTTSKPELTAFLIETNNRMTNIFKRPL